MFTFNNVSKTFRIQKWLIVGFSITDLDKGWSFIFRVRGMNSLFVI